MCSSNKYILAKIRIWRKMFMRSIGKRFGYLGEPETKLTFLCLATILNVTTRFILIQFQSSISELFCLFDNDLYVLRRTRLHSVIKKTSNYSPHRTTYHSFVLWTQHIFLQAFPPLKHFYARFGDFAVNFSEQVGVWILNISIFQDDF